MLCMVVERFHADRAPEVYRRSRLERCFPLMEADSETVFRQWTAHGEDLMDVEIIPVRTSAEAVSAIAPEL